MALKDFSVVHERSGTDIDSPLVHCFDGDQMVLAFVGRTALDDYSACRRQTSTRDPPGAL
jgi:hypothetical protein